MVRKSVWPTAFVRYSGRAGSIQDKKGGSGEIMVAVGIGVAVGGIAVDVGVGDGVHVVKTEIEELVHDVKI